jgi:hypothetical protein
LPYQQSLADLMRRDLAAQPGLSEKTMFGGLAFLIHGHMVCGIGRSGGLFRIASRDRPAALALPGVEPMKIAGRDMGGMIEVAPDLLADDSRRRRLLDMALNFVRTLPPK